MKKFVWILLAIILSPAPLFATGCSEDDCLKCKVLELRANPSSQYYDAVVGIEHIGWSLVRTKSNYTVKTLTGSYEIGDLNFVEDGKNTAELEEGDIFIVPLNKPDWSLTIEGCADPVSFRELLPEDERWHPTKTEAMQVARSIELKNDNQTLKPVPQFLPPEWVRADEFPSVFAGESCTSYQKVRVDEVREEVLVCYWELTSDEKQKLETMPMAEFIREVYHGNSLLPRGEEITIDGRTGIAVDEEGLGKGWLYEYAYVDNGIVIDVRIDSDPLEWVKTEQEKEEERNSRAVFLTYFYTETGEPESKVTIKIRLNGEGSLDKLAKIHETWLFQLSQAELDELVKTLEENGFLQMAEEVPLLAPDSSNSFITATFNGESHTVAVGTEAVPDYENMGQKIKQIVLPKIEETEPSIELIFPQP